MFDCVGAGIAGRAGRGRCIVLAMMACAAPSVVLAQSASTASASGPAGVASASGAQLPHLSSLVQKETVDPQRLPVSVTVIPFESLEYAGVLTASDAGLLAPNVLFSELTDRTFSVPRMRGIGGSPATPAVVTVFDGVPQFDGRVSSLDLLQIGQIELARGPQSALFGRGAEGGVVLIDSQRPAIGGDWSGTAAVSFGAYSQRGFTATATGPLKANVFGLSVAIHRLRHDGYASNPGSSGGRMDDRAAWAGKLQLLWTPVPRWEARLIVGVERDRDGDTGLNDLADARNNPYRVARRPEFANRDIASATVLTRWRGQRFELSTTTGVLDWNIRRQARLSFVLSSATRQERVSGAQLTQEVRVASPADATIGLFGGATLSWQAGVFAFTRGDDWELADVFAALPGDQTVRTALAVTPRLSELDGHGVAGYGQGTVSFGRMQVAAGLRIDRESTDVDGGEGRATIASPQVGLTWRARPDTAVFATVARGYRAGGFNRLSSPPNGWYGEESAVSAESGVKAMWLARRLMATVAVFRSWIDDLQIERADAVLPMRLVTDTAGRATSIGAEVEAAAKVTAGIDLFGSIGYARSRFGDGARVGTTIVAGQLLPYAPEATAMVGAQVARVVHPNVTLFGRVETVVTGTFQYDATHAERQDAHSTTRMRAGVRVGNITVDAWARNVFDRRYVPVAFATLLLAPSGLVGETAPPRTAGVSIGFVY